MRFRLLGPLGAETEEGPVDLGPHKQRSVLAVLLLNANEIVPTDHIIDMVWGESPPRTADHSVQIYISDLRKSLANGTPSDLIETRPPGYVLNIPPDSIDAYQFEALIREGLAAVRTGDIAAGRPRLERALALWTASPLADFAYEEFAQGYIRSLQELRSDALEALGNLELDQGNLDDARDLARQGIDADPMREEPRRLMMLALYRSGRQAESLRHFGEYQTVLGDELGISPSEALRELEERILLQDPTLDLTVKAPDEGNPYRGLRPFSEDDSDVYFGRESLVREVLDELASGSGFVSIVGPSGSGKSSAAQAGAVPVLREQGETVVVFQPGARPLWELAGALDRAGFGSRATLLRRFESEADALLPMIKRPVTLVVDQFEELFTLAEPDAATRFAELLAKAIRHPDVPLRVLATLRADYYDRPLSMPALAGVFTDSVVSVKPMTAFEIERAVVEPARSAGIQVEPGLLAQLVSDMGDEPGALPLLQVTLFELYERAGSALTLKDYQGLGGLHGALAGGADELLGELDEQGQDLVEQLMMRLVRKGRAMSTAQPALLRDLLDLGVDRVVLQEVLEAFGSRRLITFDRDASGSAVVEIAHEYLISEWPQLETWIEAHSEDLERLQALDHGAQEWLDAEGSDDYLLRGDRLDRFEKWSQETSLRLTKTESEFLDVSLELRDRELVEQREREEEKAALAKSARRRLWAFGAAVAALAAAVTVLVMVLIPEPPPDMVIWFDGRGDGSFGDLVGDGVDLINEVYDFDTMELTGIGQSAVIREQVEAGTPLVLSLFLRAVDEVDVDPFFELVDQYPETTFVLIDCADIPRPEELQDNLRCVTMANNELGFLAGAVAALASESGSVGFLGGVNNFIIRSFQAGFEQGALLVDPDVDIEVIYLTPEWDQMGFMAVTMAERATAVLLERGVDVVFHAAGESGWGMFQTLAISGSGVLGIGVDSDQYYQLEHIAPITGLDEEEIEATRSIMLTSILKKLNVGVFEIVDRLMSDGERIDFRGDITNGGVDFARSGTLIAQYEEDIEAIIARVASGEVRVGFEPVLPQQMLLDLVEP